MAKSKIIWSARAKKSLYNILELYIRRDRTKTKAKAVYKDLSINIKTLCKHPDTGIETNYASVYGLTIDKFLICYEVADHRIVIHSVIAK